MSLTWCNEKVANIGSRAAIGLFTILVLASVVIRFSVMVVANPKAVLLTEVKIHAVCVRSGKVPSRTADKEFYEARKRHWQLQTDIARSFDAGTKLNKLSFWREKLCKSVIAAMRENELTVHGTLTQDNNMQLSIKWYRVGYPKRAAHTLHMSLTWYNEKVANIGSRAAIGLFTILVLASVVIRFSVMVVANPKVVLFPDIILTHSLN